MTSLVLGAVGAVVGGMVGGPVGAQLGWALGSAVGTAIDPPRGPTVEGPRLSDLKAQTSDYGTIVPVMYGTVRAAGNVLWAESIKESLTTEREGGKGGGPTQTTKTYSYSQSFAVSLCEGVIDGVRRMWANGELVYSVADTSTSGSVQSEDANLGGFVVYRGTEDQGLDPTIEAALGEDAVPYRGLAYIVFTDLQLEKFGNRTPQLEFEIIKAGEPSADTIRILNQTELMGQTNFVQQVDGQYGFPRIYSQYTSYLGDVGPRFTSITGTYARYTAARKSTGSGVVDQDIGWYYDVDVSAPSGTPLTAVRGHQELGDKISPYCENAKIVGSVAYSSMPIGRLGDSFVDLYVPKDNSTPIDFAFSSRGTLMYGGVLEPSYTQGTVDLFELFDQTRHFKGAIPTLTGSRVLVFSGPDPWNNGPHGSLGLLQMADQWHIIQLVAGAPMITSSGPLDKPRDVFRFLGGWGTRVTAVGVTSCGMLEENGEDLWVFCGGAEAGNLYPLKWYRIEDGVLTIKATQQVHAGGPYTLQPAIIVKDGLVLLVFQAASPFALWGWCYFNVATRAPPLERVGVPLSDIIADQLQRVGYEPSEFDVTQLDDDIVDGYILASRPSARTAIETLTGVYFFDPVESNGVLKFVKRGSTPVAQLTYTSMAASDSSTAEAVEPLEVVRNQELALPREISLAYLDGEADYRVGVQYARRQITSSVSQMALQIPVTMTASKAKQTVDALLFNSWAERETFKFKTDRRFFAFEPTDVVNLLSPQGTRWTVRLTKRSDGSNGVIEWEAVAEEASVYSFESEGVAPPPTTGEIVPGVIPTFQIVFNSPPLADTLDTNGFYVAATGLVPQGWRGSIAQQSFDGGLTYANLGASVVLPGSASAMGYARSVLGNWNGDNLLDTVNSVTLEVVGGHLLSSATYADVLNNKNPIWIGGEIVQYQTAVQTSNTTFVLSGLRRGRKGTERFMGVHALNEPWVFLDSEDVKFVPDNLANNQVSTLVRGVTLNNQKPSSVPAGAFTDDATNVTPLSPVHAFAIEQPDGGVFFRWNRRARINAGWLNSIEVPLDETIEDFWIKLYADPFMSGDPVTIRSVNGLEYFMSPEERATLFGSTSAPFYATVAQQSGRAGLGFPATFVKV